VVRVRQQPWTLAASLNPRIADSEPLLVAGTSSRVVNSHTWWALRLRRRASCRVNIHVLVAGVPGRRRFGMSAGGLSGCAGVRRLGGCGQWWLPGVSGEGVADAGQDVDAVFAHGVDVAADVEAVLGDDLAGEPPGDLLLGFGRAQAAFADVVGGPDPGVGDEQQDVGLAVAAEFQQDPSGGLFGVAAWAGVGRDLGEPGPHGVAERADQRVGDQRCDLRLAAVAGLVERVDEPTQRTLGL